MTDKHVTTGIGIIYTIAAVLVLIGAFFTIQHYSNGISILVIGFMLGSVISAVETSRLKKKIKKLEEEIKQKN